MAKPNVIIAEFKHETNSFYPRKTGIKEFEDRYLKYSDEIIPFFKDTKTDMGGFLAGLEHEKYEITPVVAARAQVGGAVRKEVFELVKGRIIQAIDNSTNLGGILLSLHGATVIENALDGEGELLRVIRKEIAPKIPIVSTLDMHANVTDKMVKNADAFFTYQTYPHIDRFERGYKAGRCIASLIREEIVPIMKLKKIPVLSPLMDTAEEPYRNLLARANKWEKNPKVITVSLHQGFYASDIPEARMSVLAVTNGDDQLAEDIVNDIAKAVWEKRDKFKREFFSPKEGVKQAVDSCSFPVIIADVADNPGVGGTQDSTFILRELLEANAKNVALAAIVDPETVQQTIDAGVGSKVEVNLGGKLGPKKITGGTLYVTGTVKTITDGQFIDKGPVSRGAKNNIGRTIVLDVNGIEIIVLERRFQPWDAEIFRRMGIEPQDKKILIIKSTVHYKGSFGPIAKKIIEINTPTYGCNDFMHFIFRNLERPVFPLDKKVEFR